MPGVGGIPSPGVGGGMGAPPPREPPGIHVQVTEQEKEAIDRVQKINFYTVLKSFLLCFY